MVAYYVVDKNGIPGAIANSEINVEDVEARGERVIESDKYEPRLELIQKVEDDGTVIYKPIVTLNITSISGEDAVMINPVSDSYQGKVNLQVADSEFEIDVNSSIKLVLNGYSKHHIVATAEGIYVINNYMEG